MDSSDKQNDPNGTEGCYYAEFNGAGFIIIIPKDSAPVICTVAPVDLLDDGGSVRVVGVLDDSGDTELKMHLPPCFTDADSDEKELWIDAVIVGSTFAKQMLESNDG